MGYQSGAKKKAEQNKIDLLIVREQNESDWIDSDGTPYLKKICVNLIVCMPAYIHKFQPFVDKIWIEENTDIDLSKPLSLEAMNNEIYIENV